MKKYKIAVYAICKNEEKFVDRWVKSMNEADQIFVLDTGSNDNTVEKLKTLGVTVQIKKIDPWRFDVARNESLKLIPNDFDICVCTDLDEVFEPGWRKQLELLWNDKTDRIKYNYNWSFDEYNSPAVNFYIEKIHTRNNYKWTHPVHEVLTYLNNDTEMVITTDNITLNHYPDSTKSRSNYLQLLELSVEEDPTNDRNMHYLGREYMYYKKWNECIDTLIKHLNLKTATWKDERSASMRFISRAYQNLKRYDEAKMWLDKAMIETPYLRDPFVERALLEYNLKNWKNVIKYGKMALEIESHPKSYINEPFSFNETIYDIMSIAYYQLEDFEESYHFVIKALEKAPNDERIKNNKIIIEKRVS